MQRALVQMAGPKFINLADDDRGVIHPRMLSRQEQRDNNEQQHQRGGRCAQSIQSACRRSTVLTSHFGLKRSRQ
jgi:hypothetical protein